jgi:hypothetical protein
MPPQCRYCHHTFLVGTNTIATGHTFGRRNKNLLLIGQVDVLGLVLGFSNGGNSVEICDGIINPPGTAIQRTAGHA